MTTIFYDGLIISSRKSIELGHTRYFTGKVCTHEHIAQRMVRNGACVECIREGAKRHKAKHPEVRKGIVKRRREKFGDVIRERDKLARRRMRISNPEAEKRRSREYNARLEAKRVVEAGRPKPDVCEQCGEHITRIVFDHCHKTGKFRGWLCDRCNRVLGTVYDSPILLRKLANYLEKHDGEINDDDAEQAA